MHEPSVVANEGEDAVQAAGLEDRASLAGADQLQDLKNYFLNNFSRSKPTPFKRTLFPRLSTVETVTEENNFHRTVAYNGKNKTRDSKNAKAQKF